jgi:uncharacterized protein YjbI with pentapeptide repeats
VGSDRRERTGVAMQHAEFAQAIVEHRMFLNGLSGGKRVDLRNQRILKVSAPKARLKDALLTGADFSGSDLAGSDFSQAELGGVKFRGCNLSGGNFRDAEMTAVNLSEADLAGADLTSARLQNCKMYATNLEGAILKDACLDGAVLRNVDVTLPSLRDVDLSGCTAFTGLEHLEPRIQEIIRAHMRWVSSDGGNGNRADFSHADLTRLNFKHADLSVALFTGAVLRETDFRNAFLSMANFQGADLAGADFSGADLRGASFVDAKLRSTNLTGTNLSPLEVRSVGGDRVVAEIPSVLRGALLDGAICHGTNFRGAKVSDKQLERANLDDAVMLPSS